MPPASLSTLAVMNPGPMTASTSAARARQSRKPLSDTFMMAGPRSVPMPQHRDHVVRRDDPREAAVLVDDGKSDEVVFVEQRRDFVLRRIGRAEHRVLAQLRER